MVASWVAQAHVVYPPMTIVMAVGTAALCLVDHRRRDDEQRQRFGEGRRHAVIWSVTIGILLSLPMLIDQFRGSGNLGRMLGFAGQEGQGVQVGIRTITAALGAPPAWLRPINDPFVLLRGPSLAYLLAFAVTVVAVAWVIVAARKRSDTAVLALLDAALLSLIGATAVVIRTPRGGAVLAADPMLLLRPVTAILWLAIGWGGWRMVEERTLSELAATPTLRWGASAIGALAALALVSVTVFAPAKFGGYGEGLMAPIARLQPQVATAVADQPLVQVNASGWAGRLYLRHALIEDLERRGIETKTGDEERAFRRGDDPRPPTATLWVVTDPVEPKPPAPDAVLIGRTDLIPGGGLSDAGLRRRALRQTLDDAGQIELRDTDQISIADISREFFRWKTPPPDRQVLPADWVSVDSLVELYRNGLVASPDVDDALIEDIQRDAIGRFFAAEDSEVAIYLRLE